MEAPNLFLTRYLRWFIIALGILLILIIVVGGWLMISLFSIIGSPVLQDMKAVSEIINNIVIIIGAVVGGIWAYYKFVKGRLFVPKIDLGLSHKIILDDEKQIALFVEISIKNIGTSRILPQMCYVNITGIKIDEKGITEQDIISEHLKTSLKPDRLWYIEPDEIDFKTKVFSIPRIYRALLVNVVFEYEKSNRTLRTFSVSLPSE